MHVVYKSGVGFCTAAVLYHCRTFGSVLNLLYVLGTGIPCTLCVWGVVCARVHLLYVHGWACNHSHR